MAALTKKHQRTLNFAAKRLFTGKAIHVPKSLRDVPAEKYFERELHLTKNRRIFLTDYGYEHFRNVVNVIDKADFFDGMAGYSDISAAWRKVVEKAFSDGIAPESSEEIVQAIADLVNQEIADYSFVVPIFGVDLDGVDSFSFGALTILRLSTDVFEAAGVKHESGDVMRILEMNKNRLWLKGKTHGTKKIAQQKFSDQAALAVGMLAITAASMYEGCTRFPNWLHHGARRCSWSVCLVLVA